MKRTIKKQTYSNDNDSFELPAMLNLPKSAEYYERKVVSLIDQFPGQLVSIGLIMEQLEDELFRDELTLHELMYLTFNIESHLAGPDEADLTLYGDPGSILFADIKYH